MKYLYFQYLKVRVWLLRRRLRQLGFRDVADNTHPLTLLRLKIVTIERPDRIMQWLHVGLLITGLALFFKCFFHVAEHFEAAPPQHKESSQPKPAHTTTPSSPHEDLSERRAA